MNKDTLEKLAKLKKAKSTKAVDVNEEEPKDVETVETPPKEEKDIGDKLRALTGGKELTSGDLKSRLLEGMTETQRKAIEEIGNAMGVPYSEEQQAVIVHEGKPLNVVSCAGSGKTAVLIAKMFYREMIRGVPAYNMLAITFNAKAQMEIEDRYNTGKRALGLRGRPDFRTFHGLFLYLLKQTPKYKNVDVAGENRYNLPLLKKVQGDGTEDNMEILRDMFGYRGYLINNGKSRDGLENSEKYMEERRFNHKNYVTIMKEYKRLKEEDGVIDFDDMMILLRDLLEEDEGKELVKKFRSVYKDIYMDEYQDISQIQIDIMDTLIGEDHSRVVTIGDDDQSIYSFRGSDPKFIRDYTTRYFGAQRLYLSDNYRCKRNIVELVRPSIEQNKVRVDKTIRAFNEGGEVEVVTENGYDQISKIIKEDTANLYGEEFDDYAILIRTNAQRMLVSDILAGHQVPVDIGDIRYSLRNNKVYRTALGIIKAIRNQDNASFVEYGKPAFNNLSKRVFDEYRGKDNSEKNWFQDIVVHEKIPLPETTLEHIHTINSVSSMGKALVGVWQLLKPYYERLDRLGYGSLTKVLEIYAYLFNEGNGVSVYDFYQNERRKEGILNMYENSGNGIQIQTMHTVKGLEYDNVYIIGADDNIMPDENRVKRLISEGHEEEVLEYIEEERRLFYVAITRAKSRLVLHYNSSRPSRFISELSRAHLD